MNGLRRLGQKFRYGLQRFMEGRYGTDKLNMAILCAACAIVLIYTFFVPEGPVRLALWAVSYALMVWAICRTLSRNTYKRYEENRKFLRFLEQLKVPVFLIAPPHMTRGSWVPSSSLVDAAKILQSTANTPLRPNTLYRVA